MAGLSMAGGGSVRIELSEGYYVGTSPDEKTATGTGKRYWTSGDKGRDYYEGDTSVVNGLPDGRGTMVWRTGNKYEGYWKKDIKEGFGNPPPPHSFAPPAPNERNALFRIPLFPSSCEMVWLDGGNGINGVCVVFFRSPRHRRKPLCFASLFFLHRVKWFGWMGALMVFVCVFFCSLRPERTRAPPSVSHPSFSFIV